MAILPFRARRPTSRRPTGRRGVSPEALAQLHTAFNRALEGGLPDSPFIQKMRTLENLSPAYASALEGTVDALFVQLLRGEGV
jgi:hypothetical protein